jgi:hypothetical protein
MRISIPTLPWHDVPTLSPYPNGKVFAFTIIDDTDQATLESIRPIYDCLTDLGVRTTKTVWIRTPEKIPPEIKHHGDTLQRKAYRNYLLSLQKVGFEIALHNVSSSSNLRPDIITGIEEFRQTFGHYPNINVHHEKNLENLYSGIPEERLQHKHSFNLNFFNVFHSLFKNYHNFFFRRHHSPSTANPFYSQGHRCESLYFWGDISRKKIRYVRTNIFYTNLNTLKCNPQIPYRLPDTPYVNYWFDSTNGQDVHTFNRILTSSNLLRLERQKGCCILYTHFGKGFSKVKNGKHRLNPETRAKLQKLATKQHAWFPPAGVMLDRLLAFKNIAFYPFPNGAVLKNDNARPIDQITLWTKPLKTLYTLGNVPLVADTKGRIVLPQLRPGETFICLGKDYRVKDRYWHETNVPPILLDIRKLSEYCFGNFFLSHD